MGDRRSPFEQYTEADVQRLVAEYPLAWVIAAGGRTATTSLVPLYAESDPSGRLRALIGHVPRRHAIVPALESDPHALVLFLGPNAYISPTVVRDRRWGPTWNFAQARFEVLVRFDAASTDAALTQLVQCMEGVGEGHWHVGELGDRYDGMAGRVIGFRAEVLAVEARFKLGQDERPEIFEDIVQSQHDSPLAAYMRRFNSRR